MVKMIFTKFTVKRENFKRAETQEISFLSISFALFHDKNNT